MRATKTKKRTTTNRSNQNGTSGDYSFQAYESSPHFSPYVQPKLKVGQPNDKYEQEADAMADKVMRMPDNTIQRACNECENEEEDLVNGQQAPEEEIIEDNDTERIQEEEEVNIQTKSNTAPNIADNNLTQKIIQKRGKGKPLPPKTRTDMESAFGTDFSNVNIHTDNDAQDMNKNLNAQAFTHGKDIYFNSGKYKPETSEGKHLLAHELTHVIQQGKSDKNENSATTPAIQRGLFSRIKKRFKKAGRRFTRGVKKAAKGVWRGIRWAGKQPWNALKIAGKYLYRLGESVIGFVWKLFKEFPRRMLKLLSHLGSLFTKLPLRAWEGVRLLFTGNIKGFASFLWEITKSGSAWLGRLITKLLDLVSFGEFMDIVFTVNRMSWGGFLFRYLNLNSLGGFTDILFRFIKRNTRKMTSTEIREAKKIFGNSITYRLVRIDETSIIAMLASLNGGDTAVVTFHTINFPRKIKTSSSCGDNSDMGWLIHELVHVAQMETVGTQYIGEALYAQWTSGYDYGGGEALVGKRLRDFNREQQGDIIQDAYGVLYCPDYSQTYASEYNRMITDLQKGCL